MAKLNKHILIALAFITIISGISLTVAPIAQASIYCVSDRCKAAEAAEAEAQAKADGAYATANTLQGEVDRLNAEIAIIQSRIEANEALSADLEVSIKENEEKLEIQQAALASMLVDMHFEGQPEAIMILAGSSSISDYAEKQSRLDTVKTQVNLSTQTIKSIKQELENQHAEVERIIIDQKTQRANIESKRSEQAALVAKYQGDAAAYAADAEEARQIKLAEIEANRQAVTGAIGGNRFSGGYDTYPHRGWCLGGGGPWLSQNNMYGGYLCQCTDYAGWKVYEYTKGRIRIAGLGWGNANTWDYYAELSGYDLWLSYEPAPNTVAVSHAGDWGHVMWVEGVNGDGTISISEYNFDPYLFTTSPNVPTAGLVFIHFDNYAY